MPNLEEMVRRQRALAEFGEFVLDHENLQEVLQEGCRLIALALDADLSKVVEIDRPANKGLIRAGHGWDPGVVGVTTIDLDERSSEAHAIRSGKPLITQDIATEERFHFPKFMRDHGVVALVNVPIFLPGRKAYGVLQVDARERRDFVQEDIEFLMTYAMVLGPVIGRLKTAAELRETDERLHLIIENATDYVIIVSDPKDTITGWLAGSRRILGWNEDEAIGQTTAIIFTEEDIEAGVHARELAGAVEGGSSPNVRWHRRKDGSRVFLDGQTVALSGPDGELRGFLKIGQDVTQRKRDADRQEVLLAELQHRVRNVLAMVRSIIRRTAENSPGADGLTRQLEGRIDALARTQALLTRAFGVGVQLESIVREELLAQAAEEHAITVAGPPIELSSKAAEVLTLAIHELATNATKHGALGAAGRIAVEWSVEDRGPERWLQFQWTETGVCIPAADPKAGFGTELITRRVPYELDGFAVIELEPDGARCRIEFPLAPGRSILETAEPAQNARS